MTEPAVVLKTFTLGADTYEPQTDGKGNPRFVFLPPALRSAFINRPDPIVRECTPAELAWLYENGRVARSYCQRNGALDLASGRAQAMENARSEARVDEPAPDEKSNSGDAAASEGDASTDLIELVHDALDEGLKAPMVEALRAVGLDPDDYSNNSKRKAALESWLELQG